MVQLQEDIRSWSPNQFLTMTSLIEWQIKFHEGLQHVYF